MRTTRAWPVSWLCLVAALASTGCAPIVAGALVAGSGGGGGGGGSGATASPPPPAPAPLRIDLDVQTGSTAGGTQVVATASRELTGRVSVFVGGVRATSVDQVQPDRVRFTTPARAANRTGPVEVRVTDARGADTAQFQYTAVPVTVSSVSPTTGPSAGGTLLTVDGSGFAGDMTVRVGGSSATSVTLVSTTRLTCVTPAGSAGAATVEVVHPDPTGGSATLLDAFTYLPPPALTVTLDVQTGSTVGGTQVVATANRPLAGSVSVTVDGVAATNVSRPAADQVQFTTPPRAANRTASVVVHVTDATETATASFDYSAAPISVAGVSPSTGSGNGGTTLTIDGAGFASGVSVKVGNAAASSVAVVSSGQLTCVTPVGPAGPATIEVAHPDPTGGTATLVGGFTYLAPSYALSLAIVSSTEEAVFEVRLSGSSTLSAPTRLGSLPAGSQPLGLVAATADTLLTIDRATASLQTFSRPSGQVTATRSLDTNSEVGQRGLTRTARGRLFGVIGGRNLRYVDPRNGQTFNLDPLTGATRVEALAIDPWGNMFAAGSPGDDDLAERLYRVDLSAFGRGVMTDVGAFGAGVDLDALTFASDGRLLGLRAPATGTAQLFEVDVSTGAATLLGDLGVSGATGITEVVTWITRSDVGGPWVRRTVPEVIVSTQDALEVVLQGEALGAGTTVTPQGSAGAVLSERWSAQGDLRVITIARPTTATGTIEYRLTNAAGTTAFRLHVLDGAAPLVVSAGDVLRLAGTVRVPSLTIQAGGVLRGVGLRPLLVFSDGVVQLDGTLDVSGSAGSLPMGTGPTTPTTLNFTCGDGGDAGPGGGGGGGGGTSDGPFGSGTTTLTEGGEGGWGYTGGGGGGSSPFRASGRGGLSAGGFGGASMTPPAGTFGLGGDGGPSPGSATGGGGGYGGGGGGTGWSAGSSGLGGPASGRASPAALGGGAGAQHSSNGTGGGAGSFGTAGENGRLSEGSSTGGGLAGLTHGSADLVPLIGGSGGGGGSGRGAFEGLAGGGGGGGGALVLASRLSIVISATGGVVADGGPAVANPRSDGEGGSGSGGAIVLQAPSVSHTTGGVLRARGGVLANAGGPYPGRGGDGRLRVDAPTLILDGMSVSEATFAAIGAPTVGFFGDDVPAVAVTTPGASSGLVTIAYQVTDADGNYVFVDVERSIDGGAFAPATSAASSAPTHAVPSSAGGTPGTFTWDSAADTGAGAHSVVIRVRASDARTGGWTSTASFTVTN